MAVVAVVVLFCLFYWCVCLYKIHRAKVIQSSEECNKGEGAGNIAQDGTAANKKEGDGMAGIQKSGRTLNIHKWEGSRQN